MQTLNKNQILTWQQAYDWAKLPTPKYICFGRSCRSKDAQAFFKPFIDAGYIDNNTLKFTGVFRLTEKGMTQFEKLKDKL